MSLTRPFNLSNWIVENKHLLKPPVGNVQVYKEAGDFIVMVVGGPNSRKDFHYNEGEELFYQLEGDIQVGVYVDEKIEYLDIKQGDMFLLPSKVPHSPQRGPGTIGLVIERIRASQEADGFLWFCENCGNKLYEEYLMITDIVKQLPPVMERFYSQGALRTCTKCGTIMEPPKKLSA